MALTNYTLKTIANIKNNPKKLGQMLNGCKKDIEVQNGKIARAEKLAQSKLDKLNKKYNMSVNADLNEIQRILDEMRRKRDDEGIEINMDLFWFLADAKTYLENKANAEKWIQYNNDIMDYIEPMISQHAEAEEQKKAEVSGLLDILKSELTEFHDQWMKRMSEWHDKHYDYVIEHTAEEEKEVRALEHQYRELQHKSYEIGLSLDRFKIENDMKSLEKKISNCYKVINDLSNKMGKGAYLKYMAELCEKTWQNDTIKLANDCKGKFDIDEANLKVGSAKPTAKGFEIVLTDGKPRYIYARIIWCAEDSVLVSPHNRYIITSKKV